MLRGREENSISLSAGSWVSQAFEQVLAGVTPSPGAGVTPSPGTAAPAGPGAARGRGGRHQPGCPGFLAGRQVPRCSRLLELVVSCFCPILESYMYPPNYLSEIIVGTELK